MGGSRVRSALLAGLVLLMASCAGIQSGAIVDSLSEKAGYACYTYLPEYRSITAGLCDLRTVIFEGDDPMAVQLLLKDQVGRLWIGATENDKVFVALILNDFVRMTGLDVPTPEAGSVTKWLSFLGAFCGGVDLAKRT